MQNIGFRDSGDVITPPQPSSAFTELRLLHGALSWAALAFLLL